MLKAVKTLAEIENKMFLDQGASYRETLGRVIPHMTDAFRGEDEGFRSHLGASMIGRACARQIWYGFRWTQKPLFNGKTLRLFNRGHLEEARFIALLLMIGVKVYQQDEKGNQFRISELGGHFGGSGDGIGIGIPDLEANTPCLLEFKTHGQKSFDKLIDKGMKVAKPEHFTQMQVYMRKMNLTVGLYGAVNKNKDELHFELVYLDPTHADLFLQRGCNIIMMEKAPDRINKSPGWHECMYCDFKQLCHYNDRTSFERNCRTCHFAQVRENGTWVCGQTGEVRDKAAQLKGCDDYEVFWMDS